LGLQDRVVVGFLGTFGPWHGASVLAEAATQVGDQSRCHFLFIGDGDQRPAAEAIIQAAGRAARATFVGRQPHRLTPVYLDACDILVSPHIKSSDGSEFFGSPTKLFEYMAMARPVAASRLGQIAEVIVDGEDGLLVPPGDPVELARALERLASDQPLRSRLGQRARRTVVERFTWKDNAARVFETVRTTLSAR
jgi:glycosyltransferase involved in cell wall biosynthesis